MFITFFDTLRENSCSFIFLISPITGGRASDQTSNPGIKDIIALK